MSDAQGTQVVLLGTGTPNAEPERSGPSIAVIVNETPYIVDAGPGVVRRANAAFRAGIAALGFAKLTRLFLTHLHSDHTAGVPDLILTPWVLERTDPLHVFGPQGVRQMTEHLLAAYQGDIQERTLGPEPANETGWAVITHEITPGIVYQDENVQVEAFPTRHGTWSALGYTFHTAEGTVVLSGDTAPTGAVIEQARHCDLLIHEVYSSAGLQTLPAAWQRYHSQVHTSTLELAAIASQARPGLLVLVHQLFWGIPERDVVGEIATGYDGKVVSGKDLDVFEIGQSTTRTRRER